MQHEAETMGVTLDDSRVPSGKLTHRLWGPWPVIMDVLRELMPPRLFQEAALARGHGPLESGLWFRGLTPVPSGVVPQAPSEETFVWAVRPEGDVIDGTVYTDGSLFDGLPRFCGPCSRPGWAFVAADDSGRVTASAHGVPPPWVTDIHGTELWALQMASAHALPGTSFRIDCFSVLDVYARGSVSATSASRYYARIWNLICNNFDDSLDADHTRQSHTAW